MYRCIASHMLQNIYLQNLKICTKNQHRLYQRSLILCTSQLANLSSNLEHHIQLGDDSYIQVASLKGKTDKVLDPEV